MNKHKKQLYTPASTLENFILIPINITSGLINTFSSIFPIY